MLLLNILFKLIILSVLLVFVGLPILNPLLMFCFFILLIFILTGKLRKFNSYSAILSIACLLIFLITIISPLPKIHEGHNYLFFVGEESDELKKSLPANVYNLSKKRFNKRYPPTLQCEKQIYGCWRFFGDIKRPYAFSADSFWQKPIWSRIVNEFSVNSLMENRTGFLNSLAPKGDTSSNWYSDKFSDKNPNRKKAPYFVKWRLPQSAEGGELCSEGNIAAINQNNLVNLEFESIKKCIILDNANLPMEIIGLQFDKGDSFKLSYSLPKHLFLINKLFLTLKIISIFVFIFSWVKPRFNIVFPVLGFSFIANLIWGKKLYLSHLNLFFDGGGDTLTHWGYGRWLTESLKNSNFYEFFLGVERVYYFMPGYRYFRSIEMIIFGESSILSYFAIILIPCLLYFILRKFLPVLHSFISISLLLIILPSYPDSVSHYPECVGYPLGLLGMIFGLSSIERNSKSTKFIFLSSFFLALSIFMRPNLLPASLLFLIGCIKFSKENYFFKNIVFSLIGFIPALLPLLHNMYFGNEFVLLTKAATIDENILAPPSYWSESIIAIIKGDFHNETLIYIANHFGRYIFGPGGIVFLLTIIIITLLTPILFYLGKLKNFIDNIIMTINKPLKLLFLYWFGLQIMLIFYHPANRYAVMSALVSILIFIIISLKAFAKNPNLISRKIDNYEEATLLNSPKNVVSCIVQIWPLGLFPIASGTFCSLFFLIFGYYINLIFGWQYTLTASFFLIIIGLWSTKKYIGNNIDSDPKEVVIDEAAGQLIASAAAGVNIYLNILSFFLFRFFDITKLGPIKSIENKGGSLGIIFDDVLAGIFSAIIIILINIYFLPYI